MGANRELVERIFEAENRGDFEAAAALYAADATYVDASGTIHGRAAFMRRHLGVQGDYSFLLPALDGRLRELRDPTAGQTRTRTKADLYSSLAGQPLLVEQARAQRPGAPPRPSRH